MNKLNADEKVMTCIYPYVRNVPNYPISLRLIASTGECSAEEVKKLFKDFIAVKLMKRQRYFSDQYTLTPDGFRRVKHVWERCHAMLSADLDRINAN